LRLARADLTLVLKTPYSSKYQKHQFGDPYENLKTFGQVIESQYIFAGIGGYHDKCYEQRNELNMELESKESEELVGHVGGEWGVGRDGFLVAVDCVAMDLVVVG
jgi:hypothetical protein